MSYSFRIGGDEIDIYRVTIKDTTYVVLARELFVPGLAVVQEVLSKDGNPDWVGGIIMSRWIKSRKKGGKERKIWVFYENIFPNICALHHGIEGYEQSRCGSLPVTRKAIQQSVQVQASLLGLRKGNAERRMPIVVREVNKLLSGLTGGRGDKEIYSAEMQFIRIKLGKDSIDRVNGPALLPRLINARVGLIRRETGMVNKNAVFQQRRSVILSTLAILDYTVECAKACCQQLLDERKSIEHDEDVRTFAQDMLLSYALLFDSIDIKPHVVTLRYAANEFRRISHLFGEGLFDDAYKILSVSEASFALRTVRTDLERVFFRLSRIVNLHHAKQQPTPLKEDIQRMENAITAITELDTDNMVDFDAAAIADQLESVVRAYSHKLYKDAHDQLKALCLLI